MSKQTYADKLKDPRWQRMRLKILERDVWTCCYCRDKETELHVHHLYYAQSRNPWDVPEHALITLCRKCHAIEEELKNSFSILSCYKTADLLTVFGVRECESNTSAIIYRRQAFESPVAMVELPHDFVVLMSGRLGNTFNTAC